MTDEKTRFVLDRILSLMVEKGITQKAICRELGLCESTVISWRGEHSTSYMQHLGKIAAILGVEKSDLLTWRPSPEWEKLARYKLSIGGDNPATADERRAVLDRILTVVKKRGLTQRALNKGLGGSGAACSCWKKGISRSYLKHSGKIAAFLGVEERYLLMGEDEPDFPNGEYYEKLEQSKAYANALSKEEALAVVDRMRFVMERKGIWQCRLCEQLGLPETSFGYWIHDQNRSYIRYIAEIADILGVQESYLLTGENPPDLPKDVPAWYTYKPTDSKSKYTTSMPKSETFAVLDRMLSVMYEKGISQYELCKTLKIDGAVFTHWKKGKSCSHIKHSKAIADSLGVQESYLLTGEPKPDWETVATGNGAKTGSDKAVEDSIDKRAVLDRILSVIKARELTRAAVCQKAGLGTSAFDWWTQGTSCSYIRHIKAIADILDVQESYLLTGQPEPDWEAYTAERQKARKAQADKRKEAARESAAMLGLDVEQPDFGKRGFPRQLIGTKGKRGEK